MTDIPLSLIEQAFYKCREIDMSKPRVDVFEMYVPLEFNIDYSNPDSVTEAKLKIVTFVRTVNGWVLRIKND